MKRILHSITLKILAVIVLVLCIFVIGMRQSGLANIMRTVEDEAQANAMRVAGIVAERVDAEQLTAWAQGDQSDSYNEVAKSLDDLCYTTGAALVYVTRRDAHDHEKVQFIFSSSSKEEGCEDYPVFERGEELTLAYEAGVAAYDYLYDGGDDEVALFSDKDVDTGKDHVTGMVPIIDADGQLQGIACAQFILDDGFAMGEVYTQRILQRAVVLAVVGLLVLTLFLHYFVIHPLHQITAESTRFASTHVPGEESISKLLKKRDEIGSLANAVNEMEEQVCAYLDVLVQVTAQNERIGTELELAKRIQADMLPNIFPAFPTRSEFDIHASMDPAKEVGGDFYNFFLVDEDHLCMMMADVSGKGVPAALFMMASMIILTNYARMGSSPNEVLQMANDTICANNREHMFVTVWVGILEISTGRLIASSAGHEYPFLQHGDGDFELFKDEHGFVLGGMDGLTYDCYEVNMEPGSRVFVYTDGVPEATNANEEAFGTERMLRALNHDAHVPPKKTLEFVKHDVFEFVGDAEQFDDLTMLCLEYKGVPDSQKG